MTGVYDRALGAEADDLHPKVRERYGIDSDDEQVCVGRGEMDISRNTLLLPVLYGMALDNLLFPEGGDSVPFSVHTVGHRTHAGHEALTTTRLFEFERRTRRFDSLTVWDAERDRLLDFLGGRGLIATELHPRVESGALVIDAGKQWVRIGNHYLPIPGPFTASTEVRDRYDDAEKQYHVTAVVESTLTGRILTYEGAFIQEFTAVDGVPDEFKIAQGLDRLPPG